ncbi:MAG: CPBP family intramembrane glutamic endopeptidase [Segetibacter sp.]
MVCTCYSPDAFYNVAFVFGNAPDGAATPRTTYSVSISTGIFCVFFITAAGEEAGWMGYSIEQMQNHWGALKASLILGLVWAVWHIIPYIQAHHNATWIVWQCLFTVAARVIIVWFYNNTGKSVFAVILFHTMSNVRTFVFPNYGSHYNPVVTGAIMTIIAVIVTFLWGPKTLALRTICSRLLFL